MGASPGRDWRCAEDGCSPDDWVVDVFDYYYYIAGLGANSQEVLSTCVNVYWIVNVILLA